jgi:hypothetical protein
MQFASFNTTFYLLYQKTGAFFYIYRISVPSLFPYQAQMYNDLINWWYFQQTNT